MLIIDGVKYNLWVPKDEVKEFHPIIKEHSKEIFGQDTIYFDIGLKLRSVAGLGAKPDGFVIDLTKNEWYIVEAELSKHNPYDHIVNQLTRFVNAIESPTVRNYVVDALYDEVDSDKMLRAYAEEKIAGDIHRWLSKLVSQTPKIVVIIEEKTEEVIEACKILMKNFETHIVELKTFVRENAENVHAHLFEPLYTPEYKITKPETKIRKEVPLISSEKLKSLSEGTVVICPSKLEGIDFLLKYNAWGFIRIKKKPDYLAMYVSKPESKILYFGKVKDIVTPEDPNSPISKEDALQYKTFEEGKKIIVLEPESLRALEKAIPLGVKKAKMQGIKYVTLTQLINAETIDSL